MQYHHAVRPKRWKRAVLVTTTTLSAVLLIAMTTVFVFTGTDWGRERVRVFLEARLNGMIHGRARIGRISGNLMNGVTIHNFVITDSAGKPFVAAEAISGDYKLMALVFRKRIWIDHAVILRPLIVLDKPQDGKWNWRRIFPRDTTPKPPSQQLGWGDRIRFTDTKVVEGKLLVQTAWHPSEHLRTAAARDSAVREVLSGRSRLMVVRAAQGLQKIIELDSVTATFPMLRLSEPGFKDRLLQVSSLRMLAYPFRPPAADVRNLLGTFQFNDDSVWWKSAYAVMPQSKIQGDGSYQFDTGDMSLKLHGAPAVFGDLRWLYPRLPAAGRGTLDFNLQWRGAATDYLAYNADVSVNGAHITGSFGLRQTDSVAIHNTDLRFTGVDTRLLEQLIPGFSSPRRGVAAGHAIVSGGKHALALNGDVTFNDVRAGTSRVAARGEVGFLDNGGVRARELHVQMLPLQVEMLRSYAPRMPVSGVVTGTATVNGTTNVALSIVGDIDHRDRGTVSAVTGKAVIQLAGGKRFDVDVTAHPVSLVEVGRFFPSVGLRGSATGPIKLSGTLADLRLDADLRLPDGGRLAAVGRLGLAGREKSYDVTATMRIFNANTIVAKAPATSVTGRVMARGAGFELATMRATLAADLSTSKWDTLGVDSAIVRANVANGLAEIQRLDVRAPHTLATAQGSFGLVRGRSGQLTYRVGVDSLGAYNRFLPRTAADTGMVPPRPMRAARALAQARADSARVARATEIERLVTGRPGPTLAKVARPTPVRRDTLAGAVYAAGTVRGNIYDFDLRGRAGGENVVARGNFVRRFQTEYAWTNARTANSKLALAVDADSLSAMGFQFDSIGARLTYTKPNGHIEVLVQQDRQRDYGLKGDFAINMDSRQLRIADMSLRFDTVQWSAPHPALVQWGGPGIEVHDFELRNRSNGRIYANGLLPTEGVANFEFSIDNFPLSNLADLTQTDLDLAGIASLRGTMTGTLANPAFRGAFGTVNTTYNGQAVPELLGRFAYADQQLVTHVDATRKGGKPIAVLDGRIPINLAFSGVTGDRLLPNPMAVDLVADSLPVELIPSFTDIVSNTHGLVAGKMSMRGTLRRPSLTGAWFINKGEMTLNATGATIAEMVGTVRMLNDTVYVDSIVGSARGPVRLRGTLAVGNWREPSFNLYMITEAAELMNNEHGRLRTDAAVSLTGPFRDAYLSGQVDITEGVINAPEPSGRHTIGAGDPQLFNVLDTTIVSERELFPAHSPLFQNLRMEVALNVHHNTWVRNREANVEVYTEFPMMVRVQEEALALTGIVTTDRGDYKFLSKRFQIKRGSAMFIGTADLNPTLQITGEYQVQVPSRGPIDIRVLIGGTLKKPKLSLESDAQPPKTQSELLSLLAFGQSSTSLLTLNGSSIQGSAASGDLFGLGAQLAVKRLAAVALGVAVEEIEVEAGKALGTDVLNITPADVPTELVQARGVGNFFAQTKIEAGKYVNPRTFVTAQTQNGRFGTGIEHRTADGWHFTASFEPRLLLQEPTLSGQNFKRVRAYGGLIAREWRF